jgi:serine/threonine protein kinase
MDGCGAQVGGTAGCHPEKPRYLDSSRRVDSNHQPRVDTEQRLKRCNSFVGTEEYISPEILAKGGYGSSVDWWTFGILIYEMLYGVTPFKGDDREETFDNVKKGKFDFPSSPPVSRECKDLIKGLLQPNPEKRLDAAALKAHPWFKGVHFALIRNVTPPIIPEATLSDIPKEVLLDNRVPYTRASLINEDEDSGGSLVLPDSDANPGSSTNPFNHFSISMHRAAPDSPSMGVAALRNGSNGTIAYTNSQHHPHLSSGDEAHHGSSVHHTSSSRDKLARSSGNVAQLFPGHTPHPIITRKQSSQAGIMGS